MARQPRVHDELVLVDQSQIRERHSELRAGGEQPLPRLPLEPLDDVGCQAVANKTTTSLIPEAYWDDNGYPNRTLYFWPVPTQANPKTGAKVNWSDSYLAGAQAIITGAIGGLAGPARRKPSVARILFNWDDFFAWAGGNTFSRSRDNVTPRPGPVGTGTTLPCGRNGPSSITSIGCMRNSD